MKLNKNQKLLALSTLVVAIAILLFSCGSAVNNEVKNDSTLTDTTHMDSTLVDTLNK